MKGTPRRRITDTSSLTKKNTDQLGNRMMVMGAEDIYFKTMEAVFFSTSDICFMTSTSPHHPASIC